ncbi:hypothetical protein [Synoicihabitans lomoniglobus]|uniref:Cytochrome c family protein n=1 Tax=Synoicihabitans lomoniglobus TaxID=2909285 RepID=A0AAE9ZW02_9BACT|nr:hypothetical protein [Opitutaceae bacterium LMO-M01]WED65142.1 hypothetical protein PXH66_22625 [Opitutaceae bacterium LMO-M01]
MIGPIPLIRPALLVACSALLTSPLTLCAQSSAALPTLPSAIPFDVTVVPPVSLDSLQHDFDVLSWETFSAMNWPVLPNGQPDTSQQIGQNGDNATVWETWKESAAVFLPGGVKPQPWGTADEGPIPEACQAMLEPGMRVFTRVGKTPGVLTENVQPFDTGPLIDQNGRYARFEILLNESMFDTIVNQKLYNKAAQASIDSVVFDCGDTTTQQVGAIMVKASWKILNETEITSGRFHKVKALIYTAPMDNPKIDEKCEIQTVGLVGLHIVHKTKEAPQWVWTTFEHVDNCPSVDELDAKAAYSFFNPADTMSPHNEPPPRPWDPNATEPPSRRPQVVRQAPIDAPTAALNATYQTALRAINPQSVWQYYELVSTQWPTAPATDCDVATSAPANMSGTPAPQFLANTTLETYIQGRTPNVSSSCIECHLNATTTNATFSDFTYLLERAQ